jgi:hypothetical protein
MLGVLQARKGVRLQGNVVVMNLAGAANAFAIFQLSNYAAQVGTKTFRIKRVKGLNGAGADTDIHIGTGVGAAFVAALPPLHTINGFNFDFVEADLPEVEFAADMTCYPDVATVTIQVEVEELG